MKRIFLLFIINYLLFINYSFAQVIPYGDSDDQVPGGPVDTMVFHYYKPSNYDPVNSPILWAFHGTGGEGAVITNDLKSIADRRKALIVAPEMLLRLACRPIEEPDGSITIYWAPSLCKNIYRHVINRENRDTMWVYMTGFSAGGQCVTRYMLIRQAIPDSIPIRMAVSTSPLFYTYCAEYITTNINGDPIPFTPMPYPCGLLPSNDSLGICHAWSVDHLGLPYDCNSQVIMYYNENYGVLIGTADGTTDKKNERFVSCKDIRFLPDSGIQYADRYGRARNFYAFSESDAVVRGTTLKWQYAEVPGVGHDEYAMFNTKASPDDTSTIAETLLFDSPYYPPVILPPSADFTAEVSELYCNAVSFRIHCAIHRSPVSAFWNLGDGNTSTSYGDINTDFTITHTYQDTGTYQVELNIWNEIGNNSSADIVTISKLPPVADFTADTTIAYLPDPVVQFLNNSIGAEYYYWDFGDSTTSTDKNPVHTYLYADTFTIQLVAVGENGCANKIVKYNYITVSYPNQIYDLNIKQPYFTVFPNPLNNKTTIMFQLPESGEVKLKVYNYTGECIATLFDKTANAGQVYKIEFDTKKLSAGVYYGVLQTDNKQVTKKMVIIK
jgi:PKD repeat protein